MVSEILGIYSNEVKGLGYAPGDQRSMLLNEHYHKKHELSEDPTIAPL